MNTRPLEVCRLCGEHKELQSSHIIPKFVYHWLKTSSVTGHLRFGLAPNKRHQDGHKLYLLCSDCEQSFAQWEQQFKENIWNFYNAKNTKGITYGPWLLKFAASISWRVLLLMQSQDALTHFPNHMLKSMHAAENTWRAFLLNEREHPGRFENHILPMEVIDLNSSMPQNTPPYINRYITRTVDVDIVCSSTSAFVYSKLGRILIFGFIEMERSLNKIATKIHVRKGRLQATNYKWPHSLMNYFFRKAEQYSAVLDGMSDRQKERIADDFQKNIDKLPDSELFEAIKHDFYFFGNKAI